MRTTIQRIILLLLFSCSIHVVQSQDLLKAKDLSQVKVDQLSDNDIAKFKAQMSASGMSIEQAEQAALSKGMTPAEFAKLKQRLENTISQEGNQVPGRLRSSDNPSSATRTINSNDSLNKAMYLDAAKRRPLIDSLIFGSELYTSVAPSFEPNLNLATPLNYVLGPTDEINVSVYGVQQYEGSLKVSPEGYISIPSVGQLKIAGLTIENATEKIRVAMANSAYPYLRSGGSRLSVTLTKIRTIRVNVIGSVFPGNFNVSSLSTVFNVLYLAGGPNAFGSFREIELLRNGKIERKIDLYRFLLNGDQSDNIGLKDNDVIRIPPYKKRVQIEGQVKRPGKFEVLPNEKFSDILAFASGFTDTAYRADIKIYQRTDRERKVTDIKAEAYNVYEPQEGDVFVVSKLLNRFANRIRIIGAVFRPDVYALTPGLKVADLIRKADGLREDAYTGRGQILRLEDDLTRSIVAFDIAKALAGDAENNIPLRKEDEVLIASLQELKDSLQVTIQGEVKQPGKYEYVEKLTLKDLLLQAGGFTDAASKKIEIARMIRRDSIAATDSRASVILNTELSDLSATNGNIVLQPFDVVAVRKKAGYEEPQLVEITGQVQYPGSYALVSTTEKVSDILKRAGGFVFDAYPAGAFVKRYKTASERAQAENIAKKAEKTLSDSANAKQVLADITRDFDQIPLDLEAILSNPGSPADFNLRAGDVIVIPKFDAQVKISGAVLMATQITYQKKSSFKDYISDAGGFSVNAIKGKSYVVYANGRASSTKHFLFFKFYPKVLPGSEIIVPKKADKKPLNTGEIVAIATALASLVGVVIGILNLK